MREVANLSITYPETGPFSGVISKWLDRETARHLAHTAINPPLLANDILLIREEPWTVKLVNEAMLFTQWPIDRTPHAPTYTGLGIRPQRPIAVVYPEIDKKQTHYLLFGRRTISPKKFVPAFQLVPVDQNTRSQLTHPQYPPFLDQDTQWFISLHAVQPITKIQFASKNYLDEADVPPLTAFRLAVAERDRLWQAIKLSLFPCLPVTALLGALFAFLPEKTTLLPPFHYLAAGGAIAFSSIFFQQALSQFDTQLNAAISHLSNQPGIRRLATLKL